MGKREAEDTARLPHTLGHDNSFLLQGQCPRGAWMLVLHPCVSDGARAPSQGCPLTESKEGRGRDKGTTADDKAVPHRLWLLWSGCRATIQMMLWEMFPMPVRWSSTRAGGARGW